ncbi:MAG TPA: hypothetical protein VNK95_19680 [Caldilineaceae bacterium]|nr:hypothetical protein [Caldilineaceae bacterium]
MALTEIEFELPAEQFALMGYPHLRQGQPLTLQLETVMLMPEPGGEGWFTVQPERLAAQFVQVGRARYAFAGQITQAELDQEEGIESATLLVQCGDIPLRVVCGPREDGTLPFGTWETRYLAGSGRVLGIVEESFATGVGEQVGVTIWQFHRLSLTPGDPHFGQWHETVELLPAPYQADRVIVTARLHRKAI